MGKVQALVDAHKATATTGNPLESRDEPKLCKDCKHFKSPTTCLYGPLDLINGHRIVLDAYGWRSSSIRSDGPQCGVEARYFEPKEG